MALTNEVRLMGHCASAPALKMSNMGTPMAKVAVYTEHWRPSHIENKYHANKGNKEYHWCVFFGKNAERAKRLLMKGSQIHLIGTLRYQRRKTNNKTSVDPQIWVDEFMITTKATMTKEVYDTIFPEHVIPYQLFIHEKSSSFDIEVCTKIMELRSQMNDQEIRRSILAFKLNIGDKDKPIYPKEYQINIGHRSQHYIKQNTYTRRFYAGNIFKDVPFNHKKAIITTSLIVDNKQFYACEFPYLNCVLNSE